MPTILTDVEKAQAWQRFRERCVELAIKSGAPTDNVVDVAKRIATYIIAKADEEIPVVEESE